MQASQASRFSNYFDSSVNIFQSDGRETAGRATATASHYRVSTNPDYHREQTPKFNPASSGGLSSVLPRLPVIGRMN